MTFVHPNTWNLFCCPNRVTYLPMAIDFYGIVRADLEEIDFAAFLIENRIEM